MFGFLEGELEMRVCLRSQLYKFPDEGIAKTSSFVTVHVILMPTQVTFSGESLFSSDPIVSIAHSAAFDYVSIQPSASERPLEELSLSRSEAGRASEHSLGTGHHERQCASAGLRSRRR
jgi:hypothetical protein